MKGRRLPYGIYDYEKLKSKNFIYIDKTKYIEKLENSSDYVLFTRPRRFGKSLFVSMLENYYDIKKKDKFEKLFANTYIGENPTEERNSYYILRFNFSGINTKDERTTEKAFISKIVNSLKRFIEKYEIKDVTIEANDKDASMILDDFMTDIVPKINGSIYLLIDEYDQFANELLGFNRQAYFNVVQKNGFARKFYEIIKSEVADSTIDRMFITGVTPIAMDGMTSGYNIGDYTTTLQEFNEMMGFTEDEVDFILREVLDEDVYKENKKDILEEMKYYYDGYKFNEYAKKHVYNSDM